MPTAERSLKAGRRTLQDASGAWSLWIAIPLDVIGLYLILASFHLIPHAWPAPDLSTWILLTSAVALFAVARAIMLLALRRLLRLRIASDSWSRIAAKRSHPH